MPNPVLKQIQLPSGSIYDLQDARVDSIVDLNVVDFIGISTTAITDGGSETPTIDGAQVTPKKGNLVIYNSKEFVYGTDNKWHEMGDTTGLGALAYKDSAAGTVDIGHGHTASASQPTFTGSQSTVAVTATANPSGNYQPAGTVSQPTFSGSELTSTGSFTPEGTITFGATTAQDFTVSGGEGTATYTPAGSVSQPTFTGDALTSTGTYTPAGSVAITENLIQPTVEAAASGAATYTPAGSVSAPTITVTPTTGTVNEVDTINTVATGVTAAAPGATAPDNNLTYYAVEGTTLKLYQLGYSTGAAITAKNASVVTDASATASAPTFTGTGVRLQTSNQFNAPTAATFSGTEGNISVSGTPEGTVSQPTFTGTGTRLSGSVQTATSATFTGTPGSLSVTGTPAGTVSQPTFEGTTVQIAGTTTAEGSVSTPDITVVDYTGTKSVTVS